MELATALTWPGTLAIRAGCVGDAASCCAVFLTASTELLIASTWLGKSLLAELTSALASLASSELRAQRARAALEHVHATEVLTDFLRLRRLRQ